jgi:hypothetical protein
MSLIFRATTTDAGALVSFRWSTVQPPGIGRMVSGEASAIATTWPSFGSFLSAVASVSP